uniref:DNA-directed RNA polymerase III subunit n=1 Tax=Biomphalaria glabrata TaxID=6526 RepID=A0A2C9LNZ0_BIOGL
MSGRGRGRGRGASINLEALGLGRGEILPTVAQPPPLYPPLLFKPVPLVTTDDYNYILNLKQELRESFHKSPYFIKEPNKVKDIVRYSDKYQLGLNDSSTNWMPDWTRFPSELKEKVKRKRAVHFVKPNIKKAKVAQVEDVSQLLEKLEDTDAKSVNMEEVEGHDGDEEDKKKEKEEGEEEEEEEVDDEDVEEETDYNLDYFDNGEEYGDDDEDDDEGPTY